MPRRARRAVLVLAKGGGLMRYLSLFSGMEAAHLAWAPIGWKCVAVSEIESAPCALLRYRLPDVPNLGDVTAITDAQIASLGRIDVVIGGSPCQDLSVAGRRAGLAGARSSLFHHQMRIFNAARHFCGVRWLVWENVPGAFSSNQGRDFAVVVGAMAGSELPVPAGGWGSEGVALGDNGLVEWSVLDAQWFGVAQRRRLVFAVLDSGNWADRGPVLLERDSMRGDSAPSRDQGEGVTGTLSARTQGGGGLGTDFECQGGLVAGTLSANPKAAGSATQQDAHAGLLIPAVAHTLRAEGFDASEDGTGRGTPLVPVAFAQNQRDELREVAVAGALAAQPGMKQTTYLAFGCKDSDPARSVSDQVAPTLRAMGHQASHPNAGGQVAVAFPGMSVRRLTPRECERLQGAPDDWTLVPNAQGKPMADGPRYRMLGNSFAVPVIQWIGEQIQHAHVRSSEIQRLRDAATQATEQLRAALATN